MGLIDISLMREALHMLYHDRMDVSYPVTTVVGGISRVSVPAEPQLKDVPGRTSYPIGQTDNSSSNYVAESNQVIYSCDPEYDIPSGSKVVIRRYNSAGVLYKTMTGETSTKDSSVASASVAENHQEVPVNLAGIA